MKLKKILQKTTKINRTPYKASGGVQRVLIEERIKSLKNDIRRLKLSIKKKCRSCCGGVTSEIEKCQVKKCDLWKIINDNGKKGCKIKKT